MKYRQQPILANISILIFFFGTVSLLKGEKIIEISPPKCVTHLLAKLIKMLDERYKNDKTCHGWVSLDQQQIDQLDDSEFLRGHLIYNAQNLKLFQKNFSKGFLIIRDPRSQIVSSAHWVKKHFRVWEDYKNESISTIIYSLILDGSKIYGTQFKAPEIYALNRIGDFYQCYFPWLKEQNICCVKFENLVGPNGGGTLYRQILEIKKVEKFLNIPLSETKLNYILKKLFGGTKTFRVGKIDEWKKYFTLDHKKNSIKKLVAC